MPRPPKCRRVSCLPQSTYFKPAGVPLRILNEVVLSVEEAEAIRLKDLEGLEQEDGARRMNVSRPTFQRILVSARQKLADALLYGKAISIKGGHFEMVSPRFRCLNSHEWGVPFEEVTVRTPELYPTCSSTRIVTIEYNKHGPGK